MLLFLWNLEYVEWNNCWFVEIRNWFSSVVKNWIKERSKDIKEEEEEKESEGGRILGGKRKEGMVENF